MNSTGKSVMVIFLYGTLFTSCSHEVIVPDSPVISFSYDIQGIIIGNCTQSGCHSSSGQSEFPLVTYQDVMKIVEHGNAKKSRLYESIKGISSKLMPPSSIPPLNNDQIKYIYLWIEQGAKNN